MLKALYCRAFETALPFDLSDKNLLTVPVFQFKTQWVHTCVYCDDIYYKEAKQM